MLLALSMGIGAEDAKASSKQRGAMRKRGAELTKLLLVSATLMTLVSGCATDLVHDSAVCDGLAALVDAHAQALSTDGGDKSVVTGERMIAAFDAACTNN